jgi:hypothetical protein
MTEKCMAKFYVMNFQAQCRIMNRESSICVSINKDSSQVS